jgi:dihydropyrimidinase
VKDGAIAALAAPGTFPASQAARVIEAGQRGGDARRHRSARALRLVHPAAAPRRPAGEQRPPELVSRAALFGGTTTLIDFAACKPDRAGDESSSQSVRDAIEARDQDWAGKCYCDYAYHVMLRGKVPPATIAELKEAVQAGYAPPRSSPPTSRRAAPAA